jgi:hypothetical protein
MDKAERRRLNEMCKRTGIDVIALAESFNVRWMKGMKSYPVWELLDLVQEGLSVVVEGKAGEIGKVFIEDEEHMLNLFSCPVKTRELLKEFE